MSKVGYIRAESAAPVVPEKAIVIDDPSEISRPTPQRPPAWVWIGLFVLAAVALMWMLYKSGVRQFSTGSFFIFPVMMVSMVMMMRGRGGGDKKNRGSAKNQERADYLRKLDELRTEVHQAAEAQASEIAFHHPDPVDGSLATLVGTARMWERVPGKRGNWGHVRLGVGVTRLRTRLNPPAKVAPPEFRETVTTVAAREFLKAQNVIHDVPRPLHLFDQIGWSFFGEPQQREIIQGVLRSLVCQLCVFHGPDDVQVAIVTDDGPAWEWAKWLPHTADRAYVDGCGPLRLIFGDVKSFMGRFGAELGALRPFAPMIEGSQLPERWLVVVVDMPGADCTEITGATGRLGVSLLEATGNADSVVANQESAFVFDDIGNLLKAPDDRREAY